MTGRLIAVVGPSGVGKDSLMQALIARCPDLGLVRRVITRQGDLGGEDFDAVGEAEFESLRRAGRFCVTWRAHGLFYGIPEETRLRVAAGEHLLVNLSRDVLSEVAAAFPSFAVLNVTARDDTLAARLRARGRETEEDIARRLARAAKPLPEGLPVLTVCNDGALDDAVDRALALIQPVRA